MFPSKVEVINRLSPSPHKGDCWVVKRAYINANVHMEGRGGRVIMLSWKQSGNRRMLVSYSNYNNSRKCKWYRTENRQQWPIGNMKDRMDDKGTQGHFWRWCYSYFSWCNEAFTDMWLCSIGKFVTFSHCVCIINT